MKSPFEKRFDAALNSLIETRRVDEGDVRATAIVTLADLFLEAVRRGSQDQPAHFTELMSGLLPRVDPQVRARVARRLAHSDALPHEIVAQIAADEPSVAGPMLRQSPLLSHDDLMAVAEGDSHDKALAIAGRADLPGEVALRLIARGEPAIGAAIAESPGREPEAAEADMIAAIPDLPARAAGRLAGLRGISNASLARLFWLVDGAMRQRILQRIERRREAVGADAGLRLVRGRVLDGERLFALAAARRHDEMARDFSMALGLSPALAERIVGDAGGEALVVAGRAGGLGCDHVTGLVLMSTDEAATSYAALQALAALAERMAQTTAAHIVGLWSGGAGETAAVARHEPAVARPAARAETSAQGLPRKLHDRVARSTTAREG